VIKPRVGSKGLARIHKNPLFEYYVWLSGGGGTSFFIQNEKLSKVVHNVLSKSL